ncbi:MAG: bifunctional adenosylcobinamide kinase/adenosylcobinamide-phosphate guanylyltransferase [Methyloligellaceae bacterium]
MDTFELALNESLLVLGGARSGKSRYAERIAELVDLPKIYVATAEPRDSEMTARIAEHQRRRTSSWDTLEEAYEVPAVIQDHVSRECTILVDCLTIWLSNLMLADRNIDEEVTALLKAIQDFRGRLILVSNEVGFGIVPDNKLGREFRDLSGSVNQQVAACADRVQFIIAGYPMNLKARDN